MYVVSFKGPSSGMRGTVWEGLPRKWGKHFECAASDCKCIMNSREGDTYRFWYHKCSVKPYVAERIVFFLTKFMATAR